MTYSKAMAVIRQRVKTRVGYPVQLDEQEFDRPTDGGIWVRATILPGSSNQVTVGIKRFRHTGILVLAFFMPKGKGDGKLWDAITEVTPSFRSSKVDGIEWRTPKPNKINETGAEHNRYSDDATRSAASVEAQINLTCPYRYEEY